MPSNKQYHKDYYELNKEKRKAAVKKWRKENPEKFKAYNKEYQKIYQKEYQKDLPIEFRRKYQNQYIINLIDKRRIK